MKTSNKIILTTGAIPFLCVFILALVLKMLPLEGKVSDTNLVDKSLWITKTIPLKDFNSISSDGMWEIHLSQADDYLVEIKAPEDIMEMITAKKDDQTLSLDYLHIPRQSQNYSKVEVHIHLPSLSGVNMNGASDLYFQELAIESLTIHTNGLVKLSGTDSTIENLSLTCNGMSKIDLSGTSVTNADVRCDGVFSLDLLMNGGDLKGRLSGIGTLFCQGEMRRNQMEILSPFSKFVSSVKPPEPPELPLFRQRK